MLSHKHERHAVLSVNPVALIHKQEAGKPFNHLNVTRLNN